MRKRPRQTSQIASLRASGLSTLGAGPSLTAGKRVIRLKGELDLNASPQLEAALLEAERTDAKQIVVDLRDLTFVDSRGLAVLVHAASRSASHGDQLRMTAGRDHVARVLRLTALDTALPFQVEPSAAPA